MAIYTRSAAAGAAAAAATPFGDHHLRTSLSQQNHTKDLYGVSVNTN